MGAAVAYAMNPVEESYQFKFFLKGMQTREDLDTLIDYAYQDCVDMGEYVIIPTLCDIGDFVGACFTESLIERALLYDDVEWWGVSLKKEIESIDEDNEDRDIYSDVYEMFSNSGGLSKKDDLGAAFFEDVEYMLRKKNLFFINSDDSSHAIFERFEDHYVNTKYHTYAHVNKDLINSPVLEVW